MKLNLGCGKNILEGWVNVDKEWSPGVIGHHPPESLLKWDLEGGGKPYEDSTVDEMLMSHVIEHISNTMGLMDTLYQMAKPGCKLTIRCPYGSSDDAWEDPTHVRPYFLGSFYPFAQTYYWRADYGYRGDWQVKKITLAVSKPLADQANKSEELLMQWVMTHRNVVREMVAELVAIKPGREAKRELQEAPEIKLMAV